MKNVTDFSFGGSILGNIYASTAPEKAGQATQNNIRH